MSSLNEKYMSQLKLPSQAKLNLLLAISPKVVGGKHLLTSVFTTIDLCDHLSFSFDPRLPNSVTLEVQNHATLPQALDIPCEQNIVHKAVKTLARTAARQLNGHLHIQIAKRIPHQAGLGGGSSNAAATLLALAELWGLDRFDAAVLEAARELGADVSFFLYGGCALMGGHGEKLLCRLPKPHLDLVLVRPATGVSTAAAYAAFDADPQPLPDAQALADLLAGAKEEPDAAPDLAENGYGPARHSEVAELIANNLTKAAISINPEIMTVTDALNATPGVCRAMLSGSGSVVFAICDSAGTARRTARTFAERGYWTHACTT